MEPLLRYCELKGYRDPSKDDYGWARMCQVLGNFFGGTNCVGIGPYTTDERMNPGAFRVNGPAKGGPKHKEVKIMGNRAVITTPERKIGLYVH